MLWLSGLRNLFNLSASFEKRATHYSHAFLVQLDGDEAGVDGLTRTLAKAKVRFVISSQKRFSELISTPYTWAMTSYEAHSWDGITAESVSLP